MVTNPEMALALFATQVWEFNRKCKLFAAPKSIVWTNDFGAEKQKKTKKSEGTFLQAMVALLYKYLCNGLMRVL